VAELVEEDGDEQPQCRGRPENPRKVPAGERVRGDRNAERVADDPGELPDLTPDEIREQREDQEERPVQLDRDTGDPPDTDSSHTPE